MMVEAQAIGEALGVRFPIDVDQRIAGAAGSARTRPRCSRTSSAAGRWRSTRWSPRCRARAELDVRVGGRFRIVFGGPDGRAHECAGEYKEVVPNRKLVFTWCWPNTTPERVSVSSTNHFEGRRKGEKPSSVQARAAVRRGSARQPQARLDWRARQARAAYLQ